MIFAHPLRLAPCVSNDDEGYWEQPATTFPRGIKPEHMFASRRTWLQHYPHYRLEKIPAARARQAAPLISRIADAAQAAAPAIEFAGFLSSLATVSRVAAHPVGDIPAAGICLTPRITPRPITAA